MRIQPEDVRRWLEGHQAATRVQEVERIRYLLTLTQEEALVTYLALLRTAGATRDNAPPSPLLLSMRRTLQRLPRS